MGKSQDILVHAFNTSPEEEIPFSTITLDQKCSQILAESPHRHTFYEILYITGGDGTHLIDFEPYFLQPPTFYFISPGQIHFWQLHSPLEGRAIMFSEDFLIFPSSNLRKVDEAGFFHTVGEAPELCLEQEHAVKIDQLLHSIEQEYQSEVISRASVLRAYLHILIVQLQRLFIMACPKQNSAYESVLVRKFKHLVAEHFVTERSIQAYAEKIGVSASHLSNILKSMTGWSPGQLIRHEIALEAKRLLVHTELTVAEVGYRLNFKDPSYFGRFFKRETGMNPTLFRQQLREKYQIFPG